MTSRCRRLRVPSISFLALIAIAGLEAQPAAVPIAEEFFPQLKPIIAGAVEQSPQMILRNIDIAQAEAARLQTRAALLPGISGGFSYSINSSAVAAAASSTSRSDGFFYNFGLNQPLFHWGTLKAQADGAQIGVQIAQRNFAEAYRLLVVLIRGQYLALVVKQHHLQNARFAHQAAQNALALAEEKLRTGQLPVGEVNNPRLAVDEAALAVDRAEADFETTKRYLCTVAGLADLPSAAIPSEIPLGPEHYNPGAAVPYLARFEQGGFAEMTFQALNLRAGIEQADLTYKVNKYRLFPKINLGAGFVQSNTTNVIGSSVSQSAVQSQSASVSAYWTIFDGFATRGAKMSALATKRSYERQLASYLTATQNQARDQEKMIGFAARAMRLADTRRELAGSGVKAATENLTRGVGSQAAVEYAQMAFNAARITATSARADYLNRWSEFVSLIGIDPALQNLPRHDRK